MAEVIFGTLTLFGIDIFCFVIDWTGVGAIVAPVIQAGGSFATSWWLHAKGGKKAFSLGRQIGKYGSNILPFVPTLTLVFWIETYLHNHPDAAPAIRKVTAITGRGKLI